MPIAVSVNMTKQVHQTVTCTACNGRGERRESVSYYDVMWLPCAWCKGNGEIRVSTKIIQDCVEPFVLVYD